MGRFFLNKIFKRVAYENIKLKDGIDMEVYGNLNWSITTSTSLAMPQHPKNSPK